MIMQRICPTKGVKSESAMPFLSYPQTFPVNLKCRNYDEEKRSDDSSRISSFGVCLVIWKNLRRFTSKCLQRTAFSSPRDLVISDAETFGNLTSCLKGGAKSYLRALARG